MTKIIKIGKPHTITNELFTRLGETIYYKDEVESIEMKISLKRGISMQFKRKKEEDEMEEIWEEMGEDKK